eukprot:GFYU01009938.1.p1 GENE.GFYU01009938.1~~GFYU01009938.1.p1  ORF type:complete len:280 (+),score=67.57 GFYU01009938.1:159-998(+)
MSVSTGGKEEFSLLAPGNASSSRGGERKKSALEMTVNPTSNEVAKDMQTFAEHVKALKKMEQTIGTQKDTKRFRLAMKEARDETQNLSRTILSVLQSHARGPEKLQLDRLSTRFKDMLEDYQKVAQSMLRKEREVEAQVSQSLSSLDQGNPLAAAAAGRDKFEPDLEGGVQEGEITMDSGLLVSYDLLQERSADIQALETDIVEVNQLFKEVAVLVNEQQEGLDQITDNVGNVKANVVRGVEELEQANRYASAARNKICIITALMLAVAVVLVLVFVKF